MKKIFRVIIIGSGQIGAFFDSPKSDKMLTHAHAFKKHEGFKLIGFIDKDRDKAREAAQRWRCQSFSNLNEAFKQKKIDIAVVAVSDAQHFSVLEELSKYQLKLVIAEKPLTKTLDEAKKIITLYKKSNIPVVVNYTRRFIPELNNLQKKIKAGYYGEFIGGNGYYGKGLYHNGSHTIDLLRWFIGEIKSSQIIDKQNDFDSNDLSVSAILTFINNKKFYLQAVNCRVYTIFETDLLFSKGRIVIERSSQFIEEYKVVNSKIYKGYRNLIRSNRKVAGRSQALVYMVDNAYNFLLTRDKLKCSLEDGYQTLLTCHRIGGK